MYLRPTIHHTLQTATHSQPLCTSRKLIILIQVIVVTFELRLYLHDSALLFKPRRLQKYNLLVHMRVHIHVHTTVDDIEILLSCHSTVDGFVFVV